MCVWVYCSAYVTYVAYVLRYACKHTYGQHIHTKDVCVCDFGLLVCLPRTNTTTAKRLYGLRDHRVLVAARQSGKRASLTATKRCPA